MEKISIKSIDKYDDAELGIIENAFWNQMLNKDRFILLNKSDIRLVDMKEYEKLKCELLLKIRHARNIEEKAKDLVMEVIHKTYDPSCMHKNNRIENHANDDKGAWFTCMSCGFFGLEKKMGL